MKPKYWVQKGEAPLQNYYYMDDWFMPPFRLLTRLVIDLQYFMIRFARKKISVTTSTTTTGTSEVHI